MFSWVWLHTFVGPSFYKIINLLFFPHSNCYLILLKFYFTPFFA